MVRNLILRYSRQGDLLLDPMIGGGTTAIEAKLLGRNLVCYDVNPEVIKLTESLLDFKEEEINDRFLPSQEGQEGQEGKKEQEGQKVGQGTKKWGKIKTLLHDARKKNEDLKEESVDFVLMHPPYVDIIKYSEGKIQADLSNIHDIDIFCDEIEKVAHEAFRVLKSGKYCAVLMGDTRREKMYQPLTFKVMERFLRAGFVLKEDIIKVQHNCKATGFWAKRSKDFNFLLIMHEHLFVFKKV